MGPILVFKLGLASSTILPSLSHNCLIWLIDLLIIVDRWKVMVFRSPSLIHCILDFTSTSLLLSQQQVMHRKSIAQSPRIGFLEVPLPILFILELHNVSRYIPIHMKISPISYQFHQGAYASLAQACYSKISMRDLADWVGLCQRWGFKLLGFRKWKSIPKSGCSFGKLLGINFDSCAAQTRGLDIHQPT